MRSLKKVWAMFLVVAMMFSLFTVNVFAGEAAAEETAKVTLKYKGKLGSATVVKDNLTTLSFEVYLSNMQDGDLTSGVAQYTLEYTDVVKKAEFVTNSENVASIIPSGSPVKKQVGFTLSESKDINVKGDKPVGTITLTLDGEKIVSASNMSLTCIKANVNRITEDGAQPMTVDKTNAGFTLNFVDPYTVKGIDSSVDLARTVEYGGTVTPALPTKDVKVIAVKKGTTETVNNIVADVTWDNYSTEVKDGDVKKLTDTNRTITVKGSLSVGEGGEIAKDAEGKDIQAIATVTITPIADGTVVEPTGKVMENKTTGITEDKIKKSLGSTVKVSKGEGEAKIEDTYNVTWTEVVGYANEGKDYTKDDVITVNGTLTSPSVNGLFATTTTAIVGKVTVGPAEVAGGGFTVKTASKNGYGKVSVTVPKDYVVKDKKIVATMTSESFTTPVTAEYTFTEADRTAAAEAGTFTTTLKFDKTFGKLGLDTNKKYKVSVTVDGAALLTKEGDKEVKEVEKKVSAQASSGGSSSNPSSPIIVNKYDVKVTAGENGTATAEPTKAAAGDKVTVKAVPAEGFKVKDVVVKDANGNAVEVDAKTYTFTMPKGAVTVEVTFEEGKDEPGVEDGKFTDVPDTFWAAADIYTLKEAGIINGKSDKEFDPEGKVTRAEFTKMIVNLFGVKASQNTVAFTDCKADDWFTPFVAAAVEAGYVKGINDTEFAPDKTITREEACTILGRAYAKTSDKALDFKDASEISDFATAYVALLVDMGYLNGYEDGTFLPKNEITRAEAAKIIAGAFRAAEKAKTEVTEDKTEAKDNADADVKADDKTDAKADDKAEVKADAKADAKTDAKTDAKADNGETPKK